MCKCGVVDTTFSVFFFCAFLAVLGCLIYTWAMGDTRLLLYNIDSEGNLCGTKSPNLDLSDRPYLFLFDMFYFPHMSRSICTNCPRWDLKTKSEFFSYANTTRNQLCTYSVEIKDYTLLNDYDFERRGKCPTLPVLKSVDFLQVCVPEVQVNSAQSLAYVDLVVPLLHQCFRSVYNYWSLSAIAIISAFFLASLLFILLRCLCKCVLAAVLPLLLVSIGVGLGALWFAYHVVCKRLSYSTANKLPLTSFEVYNEIALFVFAVVLSVILGLLILVILINCLSFPKEIDRLFKIFAKFMDSSKLIIWLPCIGCLATTTIVTGGVAAAFCALSLIQVQSKQEWDFYKLPGPPYKERPERAGVAFAVVLALFWLPRIVINAIKLQVHLSASEYLQLAVLEFKPKDYGVRPSWFSLMSTAVTISFTECILLPVSFLSGFLLALLSPFESCFHSFLRALTFWTSAGQAVQASVADHEQDYHTSFYRAVGIGLSKMNMLPTDHRVSVALMSAEWILMFTVVAIFSLPIGVVVLQMRYAEFLSLSSPSIFLVVFFGYWIAASSLAPFSAAFITFCLNYDRVSEILDGVTKPDKASIGQTNKTGAIDFAADKQNLENWERQQRKI